MDARHVRSLHIVTATLILWIVVQTAAVATAPPSPTATSTSTSEEKATVSGVRIHSQADLSDNGAQAQVDIVARVVQLDGPDERTSTSAQNATKASAPAPPVCGYFALSPQELQSPGAWAGALEANTGDIRPWRFWTADVSFYEAGVPDSMKNLGVQPYWYICDGHSKLVYGPAPVATVQSPSKIPKTAPVQTAQS